MLPACHVFAGMVASYDVRKETVFPTTYRKRFCIWSSGELSTNMLNASPVDRTSMLAKATPVHALLRKAPLLTHRQ